METEVVTFAIVDWRKFAGVERNMEEEVQVKFKARREHYKMMNGVCLSVACLA